MSNASYSFSSPIGHIISRYLALKHALGREYVAEDKIFKHLDKFLKSADSDLTAESFTAWCQTYEH